MLTRRTERQTGSLEEERARRRASIDRAIHSSTSAGLRTSEAFRADAEEYVSGTIDHHELVRRTLARYGLA